MTIEHRSTTSMLGRFRQRARVVQIICALVLWFKRYELSILKERKRNKYIRDEYLRWQPLLDKASGESLDVMTYILKSRYDTHSVS